VFLSLLLYLPALRGGFIWDDDDHLTRNPAMATFDGLRQIWSSLAVSRYYPLTLTSFWVEHRLWGLNPLPYHAVNILLHGANAMLVFLLLRRLRVPGAWVAAAVWALHPVCAESVAWVTELKNTQSAFFFFLALICYVRFDEKPSRGGYGLTLICSVAAMLSKPSTVMIPAVFLLIAWWRRGCWRRSDWWRAAPFFALALGMSVLTVIEQQGHIDRSGSPVLLRPLERLLVAGQAGWFYLAKLIWPSNLMFFYPLWRPDPASVLNWLPLVAAAAVAATLCRWHRQPWSRGCLLGLGYFELLLFPVSGCFDIFFFHYSFVADHFQYLACLGPIALAVGAGAAVCKRTLSWGRYLGTLAAVLVLAMLGATTWRHEQIYKDPETLWRDTVARNPNAWMAHYNLANLLASQGRTSEAIAEYMATLRVRPEDVEAHNNLGIALAGQGRIEEAIAEYREALRIKPYADAHYNWGVDLASQGKIEEAMAQYRAALEIKPDYAEAHSNLGAALARQSRVPEAIAEYMAALRIQPDYAEAHQNLGLALARQGRSAEAIAEYRKALRLRSDWVPALSDLAWILATDGNAKLRNAVEAVPLAERLCGVTGSRQADAMDVLAAAYAEGGRFEDAIRVARQAIELADADGHQDLSHQIKERLALYQAGRPFHEESASPP
jgi:tetratricopeptide (TPR) repeat protein